VILLAATPGAASECSEGAIGNWIVELRATDARAQRAAYAIDPPSPDCFLAWLPLMTATEDAEPRVRRQAVRLLGEIEPTFSAVIQLLVLKLTFDTDEQVRAHAAMALRRHPAEALPHLVVATRHAVYDRWWEVMHAADEAAAVLAQIGGKAVPAIIDGVDHGILSQSEGLIILDQMDEDIAASLIASAEHATTETRVWIVGEALSHIRYERTRRTRNAAETARRDFPGVSSSGDGAFVPPNELPDDRGPLCRAFGRLLAKNDVRANVLRAGLECSVVASAAARGLEYGDRDATTEFLERAPHAFLVPAARKIIRAFRRGELPEERLFEYLDMLRYRGNNETAVRSVLAEQAVPLLRARLRDPRAPSRVRAAEDLYSWNDAAGSAAPDLVASLSDPEVKVRTAAATTLSSFSRRTPKTLSSILLLLSHHDASVRTAAVSALSSSTATLPPNAEASVVLLLSDPEWNVRSAAASTLSSLPATTAATRASILDFLSDGMEDEALWAVMMKGAPSGAASLRALLRMATESNCRGMTRALEASAIVPTPEILPALDDAIRICDSAGLIRVLARSGPAAEPWLLEYARGTRSEARVAAIEAMAAMDSPALPAARQAALLDATPEVFAAALKALRSDALDEEVRLIASVIDGRVIDLSDPQFRIPPGLYEPIPPSPEEQSMAALRTIGQRGREAAPAVRRHLAWQETASHETVTRAGMETMTTLFAIEPDQRSFAALECVFAELTDEYRGRRAREILLRNLAEVPDLAHQWLLPLLEAASAASSSRRWRSWPDPRRRPRSCPMSPRCCGSRMRRSERERRVCSLCSHSIPAFATPSSV
jgi:HEAT repeat protein